MTHFTLRKPYKRLLLYKIVEIMEYEKMLTKGALMAIKNNVNIEAPIMQVIDIERSQRRDNYYCLIISDGENINYVEISAILNCMVSIGKLTKFSLIKINNYATNYVIEPPKKPYQTIFFLDLVVIAPGTIIYKTIGIPQPILGMKASAQTAQVNEECSESDTKQELEWRSLIERGLHSIMLTNGALQYIMNNIEVKYPIMQVLSIKPCRKTASRFDRYYLYISDGKHYFYPVLLTPHLNRLISYGHLRKSSIICIKSYIYNNVTRGPNRNSQAIILKDLVVLFVCSGIKIGNPTPIGQKNSGHVDVNSILTSTDSLSEPSFEMDTFAPPTVHDLEMENVIQNLEMLNIL